MVKSNPYELPLSDNASGMRDINNTIVDSGLRIGQQVYKLVITQTRSVTPNVVDLATNSNGLSIDVAGVTVASAFNTDTDTTISDFSVALAANANIESAVINKNNITVSVIKNKEVLLDSAAITGSTIISQLTVVLQNDLRIIPAVVTIPSEPEILRLDEDNPSGTTYTGYAELGTANSAALWRIKKSVKTGTATEITYADGNRLFDNVWANRTTLSYS